MMKIDHIALYVSDLEETKEFFVHFFGAKSNTQYHNPKTGLKSYFLSFDGEARLEIMQRPEVTERNKGVIEAGYIHLSFSVGSKEDVDNLTGRLKDAGYTVLSGPRHTGDGFYESCVLGPENNQIEITE